ncbi:MAG: tetratricopeptide repeat protein [Proteobacteria bacterium]|nr:tetratricopeptide repeat protein [Pseudomonadota bacterium]
MKKTGINDGKRRQVYVAGRGQSSRKKLFLLPVFVLILLGIIFLGPWESPELAPQSLDEDKAAAIQEASAPLTTEPTLGKALDPVNLGSFAINDEGLALMNAGSFDEAIERFSQAMESFPSEEIIKNNLATAYVAAGWNSLRAKEYETALERFGRSIDTNPSSAAYKGRGIALLETGNRSGALADIERSILLDGDDPHTHVLMGTLLYEMNRLEDAERHFESALEINPANSRAADFLKKIKREVVEDSFDGKESFNFFVKYNGPENAETGYLLLMLLEEAYHKAGADLGVYPEKPVTVILYTKQQFSDVTRSPAWAGGLYDGKIRLPSGGISQKTDELMRVVYHEYTHALIHQATGGNCPTWLNEGLAQLEEGADISRAKNFLQRMGGPVPLDQLEDSFIRLDRSTALRAYATSLLAVDYIIDEYSLAYIKNILELLGEGKSISEAIRSVLYLSYRDIEKNFRDSL